MTLGTEPGMNMNIPCKHGHTSGRYFDPKRQLGRCIECHRIANAEYRQRHSKAAQGQWRRTDIKLDRDTAGEVDRARGRMPFALWVREAIEWRLMELGQ